MGNITKPSAEEMKQYIIDHIDQAVEEGWIQAYYQPVARTITGEICGMEALARWIDPVYGLLAPYEFIGVLEEAMLIHKLDGCIIRRICEDYREAVREKEPVVTVSFNLSRLDFRLCDMHEVVESAIRKNKVPRDALRVEITESMMENDEERMHDVIDRFWERGFRVWMDDFGSGYSSLNVLKDYHFDTLKIDMVFLRNFDARSREIVKSVVDMAKRIGVHTLAEGVETEEHFEFLKNIGCEKAQGYFIGKPMPYKECREYLKKRGFQLESPSKRQYYHDIGKINVLSATPLLSADDFAVNSDYRERQVPLAFVEFAGHKIRFLFANEGYQNTMKNLGVASLEEVEEEFEKGETALKEKFTAMMQKAQNTNEIVTANFVRNGNYCFAQVRAIAGYPGGNAFLCILQNLSQNVLTARSEKLADYSQSLSSIYESITLLDFNTGLSELLHRSNQTKGTYQKLPFREEIQIYAREEIYAEDRERYLQYADMDTIEERIMKSATRHVSGLFRTRTVGGTYAWMIYTLLFAGDQSEKKLLFCVRKLAPESIDFLHSGITQTFSGETPTERSEMTPELLWNNFKLYSDTGFFWKDKDRRFVGVNRKFLDYYGLKSEDELIGKTDEEMGWHVNPIPYKNDEERVLAYGEQTFLVPGNCICKGEIREIAASKMPIYRDGEVIGLMGYFLDMSEWKSKGIQMDKITLKDTLTGSLNFLGLVESVLRYQENYAFNNADFALILLDIHNFHNFNQNYGQEWGNHLLQEMAERLKKAVNLQGITGRLNGDHFLVVRQFEEESEIEGYLRQLTETVENIQKIDGIPCTVYLHTGCARYSETKDLQRLFLLAEERLQKSKKQV